MILLLTKCPKRYTLLLRTKPIAHLQQVEKKNVASDRLQRILFYQMNIDRPWCTRIWSDLFNGLTFNVRCIVVHRGIERNNMKSIRMHHCDRWTFALFRAIASVLCICCVQHNEEWSEYERVARYKRKSVFSCALIFLHFTRMTRKLLLHSFSYQLLFKRSSTFSFPPCITQLFELHFASN